MRLVLPSFPTRRSSDLLYALAAAAAVGIIFGKHIFGGFPKNIFNPALFGRLFLILAFPTAMSPWLSPFDMVSSATPRSEEHTSELQSRPHLVCRLLLEK